MKTEDMQKNRDGWFSDPGQWSPLSEGLEADKLIVVVPHPDDEIVGCAGFLQRWSEKVREIVFIHVTDGEASHGFQNTAESSLLAMRRMEEDRQARACLQMKTFVRFKECHLPDSNVALFADRLHEVLSMEADQDDIVLAPYLKDGHADHEAIGRCVLNLQQERGFTLLFYPVWLWFYQQPEAIADFRTLELSEAELERKREAIDCFQSQLDKDDPVLPDPFVQHYKTSPYEVFLVHS